ncbi:tRNA 5-methoxyuridine(34)/uridine 5-oxyacetic acid(34) synthase CmoB [Pseudoalteromonas sp. McH1-7]|uniref:tRNA U34 carboxymethyltransferase n=1 Tax=Pseudoalteromonas peptidolytica F12-50-A1 TaxID=1315280 RepID=A0A8I0T4Q7_9GAMM|nr:MULTISPECIES: tRNA 5-methoxyuridine(34)/uridine 5-oxyacetic acid(34) synthase CmoB [Pseudoalteromonas]MBE0346592.1 tRNA (mo5U34)-methyltransferase [Pseudoalteromonas peptidolytica F12-50-A1]MDW7550721.1 tRNA 5-methoxyuridine(34)/uridine 5-oxyacetic acid(34) synthase CmoB [Pseudoalteromonas peptidolytica]NLR15403.1 tRNA 5-methoxyuridine(34)/uridine 5-oxyacetic acid(34) synthase CmoB [Pseudoalteromonas peptidolytica]NUZ12750.1 tRNA 5-methoxyuridine(34)/uridine 5-oxyacetic acid(34) synthase Cmo
MNHWFTDFYATIAKTPLSHWLETLPAQLSHWQKEAQHGDWPKWEKVLKNLPDISTSHVNITTKVEIGTVEEISEGHQKQLTHLLKRMMPWRKGPFHLHGIHIDTEWRSDWKWDRLLPHISDLKGRNVLDIGCGSGYHLWRMRGEGAELVVGIDPSDLFLCQFQTIKHYNPDPNVHLLPLGVEQLPELKAFDTVFSMGVLYHRRSPIDFLAQLKAQLRKGGELVLETLVVEGDVNTVLVPTDRYAKMRNVWFIPSCDALTLWLERVGFKDIKVVNRDVTSLDEQRQTPWMETESLADFLDPDDPNKTIEGYPAPLRAIFTAKA